MARIQLVSRLRGPSGPRFAPAWPGGGEDDEFTWFSLGPLRDGPTAPVDSTSSSEGMIHFSLVLTCAARSDVPLRPKGWETRCAKALRRPVFHLLGPSGPSFAGWRNSENGENHVQESQSWFTCEPRSGTREPVLATCAAAIPDHHRPRSVADSARSRRRFPVEQADVLGPLGSPSATPGDS